MVPADRFARPRGSLDGLLFCCGLWLVGRAQRSVVARVERVGPAGLRIALLIGVESVVAPVSSWLAAHRAWGDLRALARGAIGIPPMDPNPEHDAEHSYVKKCPGNEYGG